MKTPTYRELAEQILKLPPALQQADVTVVDHTEGDVCQVQGFFQVAEDHEYVGELDVGQPVLSINLI